LGLREAGHEALHVVDLDMLGASDDEILARARAEGHVIVSADAGFGFLLAASGATGPSLVLLRSSDDLSTGQQTLLLTANLAEVAKDLERGAVVVLGRHRIRVRDLPIERSS
jgi:predicted nuclease of predicted toxin-antitoxin system